MKELPKAYESKNYEEKIYKRWENSGFFNPDICVEKGVTGKKSDPFTIVLPPPNVTGTLHVGHAAMLAIQDALIRYHRMKGDKALWIPGTDHAAIATQTKVEKILLEKGIKEPRKELGREKFLIEVNNFAQASHDTIIDQCKRMGSSLDWSREAFTLDETRTKAVRTVFKKMYDDGLIYRGYRLVNWCPRCKSTLADDEVEYRDENGKLYWIKYGPFVLATSRPETKLGDTAVAVNPKDERYKDMVGKHYMIPGVLGEFEVVVVADDAVDINFGSGAVKVTPAHSFTDYEIAQRHKVPLKQIINEEGRMMENCGKYAGMTTTEARKAIVADMEKMGLIDHVEENYQHSLSVCYRCGTIVEPLPSKQWFIDVNKEFKFKQSEDHPIKGLKDGAKVTLKKLMHHVVENGQINIIPDRFEKTYYHWIDNLRDWCISRQIWYGHRIPVWYKGEETYVGVEAPNGSDWKQDEDTLDTWFSSGLWTFSTLGWPEKTKDLQMFHPNSVMETGYDILFFWVARMILMTTYVLGEIPFETVYLHGLVRDEKGRKMSKSLGNVINPLDMIEKYGADATRLSLVLGNTPGNDIKLSEEKIQGFRNFTNKLWNISRFMLLNMENPQIGIKEPKAVTLSDKWILARLNKVISETVLNLEKFNLSYAGEQLRDFTWSDLADWYLEIAKVEGDKSEILNYILNTILKLWHPFMPYVTEAIWTEIYGEKDMLIVSEWPKTKKMDEPEEFEIIRNVIIGIRSIRSENKIEPAKKIKATIMAGKHLEPIKENSAGIVALARLESLEIKEKGVKPDASVGFVEKGVEVYVDIGTAVDAEKEKERLTKELTEVTKYIPSLEAKLNNKDFVSRAPETVISNEKKKLEEAKNKQIKLQEQLNHLK